MKVGDEGRSDRGRWHPRPSKNDHLVHVGAGFGSARSDVVAGILWIFGRSTGGCRHGASRRKICYRFIVFGPLSASKQTYPRRLRELKVLGEGETFFRPI